MEHTHTNTSNGKR